MATFTGNLIAYNNSLTKAGGMYLIGFPPTFINNTITENTTSYPTTTYGVGIFAENCIPQGKNNIVYNNNNGSPFNPNYTGTINFTYSLSEPQFSGTGNITGDPLFVNPVTWNFNLQAGSPCIDTGDPNSPLDPDGTRADMGAFYFDQNPSYPDFVVDLTYVSGSPVPPSGGNVIFDIHIVNNSGLPQDFAAWLATEYEGGQPTTLLMRFFIDFQPGWAINRPGMYFPVPGAWSGGIYRLSARVGDEPDIIWAEDGFEFVKSGADVVEGFKPHPVAGAPNPFDIIETEQLQAVSQKLLTNYPNPFNPTTTISFTLELGSNVELAVFDVSGREVARLVDGYRNAGSHEVNFDASHLSSGVYIYRLSTGTQTLSGKIVLMK
ncbi:T9SS type A sorting domain-containing protein [bacterium]|nr:T9SS type A sorting domain-containing protein [bacterium]